MQYANLTKQQNPSQGDWQKKQSSHKKVKRLLLFAVLLVMVSAAYTFLPFFLQFTKLFVASPKIVYSVIANKEPALKSTNGRTNILLLGTGGGEHEGPDLTDSIIIASIDTKSGDTVMISLPRDIWIAETQTKINAVYAEAKPKSTALEQTMDIIGKKLGMPIHYGLRIDFNGFRKAIDLVGGIDVTVENTFDDYYYPVENKEQDSCGFTEVIEPYVPTSPAPNSQATSSAKPATGPSTHIVYVNQSTGKRIAEEDVSETNNPYSCRFMHIHFDKGVTHMDGLTALRFVRSRHALGIEGSDFARSRRQQAVITAFRSQLTSKETLLDIGKIQGLLNTFGASIDTTIEQGEYGDFFLLYKRVKQTPLRSVALTDGSDNGEAVFVNPPMDEYGGRWVLIPKGNDWSVVHQAVLRAFVPPTPVPSVSSSSSPTPSASPKKR